MKKSPNKDIDQQNTIQRKDDDMKLYESKTPDDLKQSFDELDDYMKTEDNGLKKRTISAWTLSLAIHSIVLLIFSAMVFTSFKEKEYEFPPMQISKYEDPIKRTTEDKLPIKMDKEDEIIVINEDPKADDKPIIPNIEITQVEIEEEMTKGETDNISIAEMGSKGFNMAIGIGGNAAGIYGNRTGNNKRKTATSGYGPKARGALSMIDQSLRWLVRHQSPNGEFDAINYYKNCDEDGKCEPGVGAEGANVALTSYAILCFAGAGYDHLSPNKFKKSISNAISFLISKQNKDGSFGERNYENAIAVQAVCDLYGMSQDPSLKEYAQKGIDSILSRQSKDKDGYTLGWDYVVPNANRVDISITGWNIFALKSGMACGLNTKGALNGCKTMVEAAWKAANPEFAKLTDPYKDKSVFPYCYNATNGTTEKDHLSFVGACSLVFLGHQGNDLMLNTLLNDMNSRFLDNDAYKTNSYALYYASLASFTANKECFNKWQEKFIPWLLETQYKDGCKSGTWEYPNQNFPGGNTSRVLIHCYLTLSAEVVFRYNQIQKHK